MSHKAYEKELFGLNKDGSFKTWTIEAKQYTCPVDDVERVVMVIRHGKEGCKQQEKLEFFTEGKQGRTAIHQAAFEAKARVKKQLDKNYRETKEELTDIPVLAMLAKDHSKVGKAETVQQGVFTSDKFDGLRCIAKCLNVDGVKTVKLFSRTGQDYSVPHIEAELLSLMNVGEILDGELYVHGPQLQDIKSAVDRKDAVEKLAKADKAYQKKPTTLTFEKLENAKLIADIRQRLEYHVFDVVDFDKEFNERLLDLGCIMCRIDTKSIKEVKYNYASNIEELTEQLQDCISRGYEGIMYRTGDGLYESGKRSSGVWKFKLMVDEEFEILHTGVDKQGHAVFHLKNNVNDEEFDCVMGSHAFRLEAAEAGPFAYSGQYMTVQFQARNKGTLLPQFGVGKAIRNGEVIATGEFVPFE